jgi:hypothetical protein
LCVGAAGKACLPNGSVMAAVEGSRRKTLVLFCVLRLKSGNVSLEPAVGRILAAMHLAMIIAIWLVAWIPMAIYCLVAIATAPLRRAKSPAPYYGVNT